MRTVVMIAVAAVVLLGPFAFIPLQQRHARSACLSELYNSTAAPERLYLCAANGLLTADDYARLSESPTRPGSTAR